MKYIRLFIILLVVFASLAGAPRVFAAVISEQLVSSDPTSPDSGSAEGIQRFTSSSLVGSLQQVNLKMKSTTGGGVQTMQAYVNVYDSGFMLLNACVGDNVVIPSDGSINILALTFGSSCDLTGGVNIDVGFQKTGSNVSTGVIFYGSTSNEISNSSALSYNGGLNGVVDFYFQIFDVITPVPPVDTTTHIISWVPVTDSTVATGTQSIGFTGYINIDDFKENMYFSFKNNCVGQFCSLQDSLLDGPIYITDFGEFSYSTTTDLESTGLHQEEVKIFTPSFNVFGFPLFYTQLLSDKSNYNVGTSTTFFNDIYSELAAGLASTTAQVSNVCNPVGGNFTISLCFVAILYPSAEQIQSDILQLRAQAPWGYAFRLYDILNGQATSTTVSLPSISYTSASTSIFGAVTFEFDPFAALASSTSIVNMAVSDQDEPKNVWDIMSPIINIIVYLMLGFMILRDLTKIRS